MPWARSGTSFVTAPSGASEPAFDRPSVDVVVVNWNTGDYLRECLLSLAAAERSRFELGKVVVVDNASADDSLEGVTDLGLPVSIVCNAENTGFAPAANQGARAGSSDLILFLNPDTRLFADTLDRTVEFMAAPENSTIGISGGKMVGEDGAREVSCWRFPTLGMWTTMLTGLSHVFPNVFPRQRLAPDEPTSSGVVDQVIGAYFLIRRPLFEALDGFDERFFMYLEDVDLAYRARLLGHPSYFLAEVPVYHEGQVSSEQVRAERLFYLLRSRREYARKHWPRWQAAVLTGMMLVVELPARSVLAAIRGERAQALEVGRTARLYLRYLAGMRTRP